MDLALNNQQWLICHKTKPNHTKRTIYQIAESRELYNGTLLSMVHTFQSNHLRRHLLKFVDNSKFTGEK